MKLNKLSLSLAITLALGSTFGMAHAETTAAHTKAKTTTVTNTQAKATPAKATTAKTTTKADTKVETKATTAKADSKATEAKPATTEKATEAKAEAKPAAKTTEAKTTTKAKETLPAGVYTDTKDNWARDAIQAMSQAGYLSGYSDNTFKPSAQITREQAAAIYGKVLQHNLNEQELADIVTKESATSYSDVEADRWSNSAIKLVSAAGVMQGTSKTAFTPSKTMNREEFVASAASLAKKLNITENGVKVGTPWTSPFIKLPILPIACPKINGPAAKSPKIRGFIFFIFAKISVPIIPPNIPPCIAIPPCQTAGISRGFCK